MPDQRQIIRYLRECYEADNRETGIANLLGEKCRHVTFLTGSEDLLRGVLDRVPLEREPALAAMKEAELARKDKSLVYCAFPLVGPTAGQPQLPSRLCAPLVFYPATIEDDGQTAFLSVDLSQQRVNYPVLARLAGDRLGSGAAVEELLGGFPQAPFGKDDLHAIMALVIDLLGEVDVLRLAGYPELVGEKEVRRLMRSADGAGAAAIRCLPAAAVAVVPRSPETRGVLFELAEMAAAERLSLPVEMLVGRDDPPAAARRPPVADCVPAILSQPQQAVLGSAATNPLTLVIGPPGTGKSYTIAAIALDHLSRGESVLIASRMDHAVNVVGRKIEAMVGPSLGVVRGGPQRHLRELKKSLHSLLHGMRLQTPVEARAVRQLEKQLAGVRRTVAALEREIARLSAGEEHWGRLHAQAETARGLAGAVGRAKLSYRGWRLAGHGPLWTLLDRYQHAMDELTAISGRLLRVRVDRRLQLLLKHHRRELSRFSQAIRARSNEKQSRLFAEMRLDLVLQALPIWLVTLADVAQIVPLEPDLFDVAILDEATQCDIASCLPVLQRARRGVIVGDPNQLRHISFLSRQRQQAIAARNGLDRDDEARFPFRDKSILDLAGDAIGSQEQVLFLDEHFRSMPQVIAFSNREFYSGALKVMTERPDTARLVCVEPRYTSGRRTGGVNAVEAEAVAAAIARRVEEEAELPAGVCHSLGVLSPFREQADRIASLVESRLTLDALRKHDLLVGTAHAFQGEERDVIYLSLAVDGESHPATYMFLNNPNVFNVSITRARNEQYIYCSVRAEELKPGSLVRRYLESVAGPVAPAAPPSGSVRDAFLAAVGEAVEEAGFHVWSAYPVAGQRIDLVIERDGRVGAIDLIGHPGAYSGALALERCRTLRRAGLWVFPLPYRAWKHHPATCLEAISHWHAALSSRR